MMIVLLRLPRDEARCRGCDGVPVNEYKYLVIHLFNVSSQIYIGPSGIFEREREIG